VASAGRGYLSGRFESARVASYLALVRPGDCVWDVGAHKGYLSLAFARAVGPAGHVVALEPSQVNQWFLLRHLAWNGITNVTPVRVAASDHAGVDRFGGPGSTLAFRLGEGDETVRVATLDGLVDGDGLQPPDVIKIDTEGAEADVLAGGLVSALRPHTIVLVAVHSRACYRACEVLLRGHGFSVWPSAGICGRLDDDDMPWGGDQDMIAVGPECALAPDVIPTLPLLRG
jgi:FkbM family methyltransferase